MNVEQLLARYNRWRNSPPLEFPSRPTVEARIQDMQENAGVPGGSGLKYDQITIDGESLMVPPDGGLGDLCDQLDGLMRYDRRMREVAQCVRDLPAHHRTVIEVIYHTAPGIEPLSSRACSLLMEVPRQQWDLRRAAALGYVEALMRDRGMIV